MKSTNWSKRFAIACATSLFAGLALAQAPKPSPAIALIDPADATQWEGLIAGSGWQILAGPLEPDANIDKRVQTLAAKVDEAVKAGTVDASRVYIAGRSDASALVFYAISRIPDRWAAGVALGGSPRSAVDSNRLFAVNFNDVPVLWASNGANDLDYADKLRDDGLNIEWRTSTGFTNRMLLEWMAAHVRAEYPLTVDCETNSPTFASCYWVRLTKFDPGERNDVVPSTLLAGDSGSSLDLGGFGYRPSDPGPGVTVAFLPDKYNGPLHVGDVLETLDGKPIENAKGLMEILQKADSSRNAVVMVRRGNSRTRVETRIIVPRREPVVTARVKAQYNPEDHEILVISRSVTEMKVTVPAEWIPANLVWNGLTLENVKTAGCYALKLEKELLHDGPCE